MRVLDTGAASSFRLRFLSCTKVRPIREKNGFSDAFLLREEDWGGRSKGVDETTSSRNLSDA